MQRRSFLKWLSAIPLVALLKPAAAKALPPPGSLAAALSACPPGGTVVVLPGHHEMSSVPTETWAGSMPVPEMLTCEPFEPPHSFSGGITVTWPPYDEVEALSRRLKRAIHRQQDLDAAMMMRAYKDLDLDA